MSSAYRSKYRAHTTLCPRHKVKLKWDPLVGAPYRKIPKRMLLGQESHSSPGDYSTPVQDFAGGDDKGIPVLRLGVPKTRLQALMEAAPGDEPKPSIEELDEHDNLVYDAVHKAYEDPRLTERQVLILRFAWEKGLGVRSMEEIMREMRKAGVGPKGVAKSMLHRDYKQAMEIMKEILEPELEKLYGPR